MLDLHSHFTAPVAIATAELLRWRAQWLVRVRSKDGIEGVAVASERMAYLWPIAVERVLPFFVGQDAREVERLVDEVARHESNYKLAGLAFWVCVAAVEAAIFDLLGKNAGKSVGELLGGKRRQDIPVYLSSMRRDTAPEEEVARLSERLAETGARAVKFKIGGRMWNNMDASPGRTERLVALARKVLGDDITILADANGSYDAHVGVEVGRMLEEHGVRVFEEPCPWEDFEATKHVADQLELQVAGGEQDTSLEKFRWMVQNRSVDLVQPDVMNNGGFVRTLRVARLTAEASLKISPHSAKSDYRACYMLHVATAIENLGPFQEFPVERPRNRGAWYDPTFEVKAGVVPAPTGVGLGMTIEASVLRKAKVVKG
ncbi:MAG: mandelate racemase/muconate lactonizing enzyme family protein [Pirellulales bacterium]